MYLRVRPLPGERRRRAVARWPGARGGPGATAAATVTVVEPKGLRLALARSLMSQAAADAGAGAGTTHLVSRAEPLACLLFLQKDVMPIVGVVVIAAVSDPWASGFRG
jgi:hypothetical protein